MGYVKILDKIKNKKYPEMLKIKSEDEKYIVDENGIRLRGDFFEKQTRITLKNYDIINPLDIEEYIAMGGYYALEKSIFNLEKKEIIDIVKDSNLRGRGGAGFPTGKKWEGAFRQDTEIKYVICNADEGDPGAYMDRSILEGDPHVVIEGMAIAARSIGASKGYVYVRAEYPKAVQMLTHAIE